MKKMVFKLYEYGLWPKYLHFTPLNSVDGGRKLEKAGKLN